MINHYYLALDRIEIKEKDISNYQLKIEDLLSL